MTNVQGDSQRTGAKTDFDAVIIGAGFSGMYMLHSLRDKLDLSAPSSRPATASGAPGTGIDTPAYAATPQLHLLLHLRP